LIVAIAKLVALCLCGIVGSAAVGAIAFFFASIAMRPHGGSLTSPEIIPAAAVGVLGFVACVWRLWHGGAFREQVAALFEAAFNGDHLG
jgi:hypothetical protein